MFPLTLPELKTQSWEEPVELSCFQRCLRGETPIWYPSLSLDPAAAIEI